MTTWTTDTIRAGDRFPFWQDVVCRAVLNVSTTTRTDHFWARIASHSFGALRFAAFDASAHEIVRTHEHLAAAPAENYLVSLQRRGRCHITERGEEFVLEPGEIAVVDGQTQFRVAFPQPVSRIVSVIPKQLLDTRAPWLRDAKRRKISAGSRFSAITREHLMQLADGENDLAESEASVLSDNLCNLLALSFASNNGRQPELQHAALLSYCRRNLGDPELSPQMVADRFGISVRTVHLRFERLGRSFGRWVLENRLERCAAALRDPADRTTSISEIAYRCGFNDLSHFNKVFRVRFSQTPREWRASKELS
jgi:AraC family transcriptional regulator, positive regulator of tynA and feaB